jgi:sarcosine oxidase
VADGGAQETGSRVPQVIRSDVIVVGGGAMGSAAAWWLARRGRDVTLIEQYEQGHRRGSSHGGSRIFRMAYPDPFYINLARAALPLWRELEDDAGRLLLETTGGVDHGDPAMVTDIAAALKVCNVSCEQLAREEAAERWPMFRFDGPVCFQPDAGRCLADATVRALQVRAAHHGATVRFEEVASRVEAHGEGIAVTTPVDRYEAPVAVIAAGAWVGRLIGSAVALPPLTVTQEQPFHFAAASPSGPWPSFIHYRQPAIYGLETPGEGIKVAEHHTGVRVDDLDERTFAVDAAGRQRVMDYVAEWIPGLVPRSRSETTCLYTTTPSEDFVIDRRGSLVVAAGFSGHGFKFTPLVGRFLADLVETGKGPGPRFALPGPS